MPAKNIEYVIPGSQGRLVVHLEPLATEAQTIAALGVFGRLPHSCPRCNDDPTWKGFGFFVSEYCKGSGKNAEWIPNAHWTCLSCGAYVDICQRQTDDKKPARAFVRIPYEWGYAEQTKDGFPRTMLAAKNETAPENSVAVPPAKATSRDSFKSEDSSVDTSALDIPPY